MPEYLIPKVSMEVLSPRSANLPPKPRAGMTKTNPPSRPKTEDKPTNPDRIDDRWRPPATITEPGESPETYVTGKKLGKGGFAVCFEGKTKKHGVVFALKVVKAEVQQKKMMEKFRTEMQIHAKMRHPNIVEFHRAFSLSGHTYVVLELCPNGSLTDMVKARSCLSLPEVRRFMIQICGGVKYLHKRSVIHRDLKMGNVFLDSQLNLKIGDFGLAAVMADEQDRRTTLCGTPNYIAPEILSKSGTKGHDFKVDTWAIGVICYAMLMGTPPFQSKTQQEIYTKLKTLEYEWKIDSMNYIPQEAKDCVASCLNLTAADRPDMDELVDHEFFKNGVVADVLEYNCLQTKPSWLQNADPRGDRVRTGYGVDYAKICAECGVGRSFDGRPRASVGAKAKISALVEIEIENRQGTAPVTPLPEGVLYKQFVEAKNEYDLLPMVKPRERRPIVAAENTPAATSNAMLPSTTLPQRLASSVRPTQSFAAQQRQQALPKNPISRTTTTSLTMSSKPLATVTVEDKPAESQGLLKARPVRAASSRITRATLKQEIAAPPSTKISESLNEVPDRLMYDTNPTPYTGSVRGTFKAAPRSLRSLPTSTARPLSSSSIPSSDSETNTVRIASNSVREQSKPRPRSVAEPVDVEDVLVSNGDNEPAPTTFKARLINKTEPYTVLTQLTHANVIKSLSNLYTSLGQTPQTSTETHSNPYHQTGSPHPRVDKWVDYATKHGIAYILSEGSLGMILKSSKNENAASSCVVVRKAKRHTVRRARGLEHQFVPQGENVPDVEFYEQVDPSTGTKRLDVKSKEFELDLKTHSSQVNAASALLSTLSGCAVQRMKEVGLLDKFGKYMNKQMGASDYSDDNLEDMDRRHFIHFYQRMGNVGCWRFADGGLQFNFPDHTKIVLHQSEVLAFESDALIDVIYLEPSDAKILSAQGTLTNETLERRGLRTFRLSDIRESNLRRTEMEIVRTNEIKEKLSWIRGVIGCWIREGGLGRTGQEKLGWSGMQERRDDKRIKLQWVTVGRPGGDEEASGK